MLKFYEINENCQNFFQSSKFQGVEFSRAPIFSYFNPQAPVAQKIADEVVFRRFQGEGVEFF